MKTEERRTVADRAGDVLTFLNGKLPPPLRKLLPREFIGFAILGTITFAVDLAILSVLRILTPLPLPVDVGIAYLSAFGLNYVLNRTVNFRSHAPVGGQVLRYGVVMACDFGLTLGVTTGLSTLLGLDFRIARVLAAGCVAVFTYLAANFWVFRVPKETK